VLESKDAEIAIIHVESNEFQILDYDKVKGYVKPDELPEWIEKAKNWHKLEKQNS
jgi:hypothetical protein